MPHPHTCTYFRCSNKSGFKSFFQFPVNDEKRLKTWINNCGNMTIAHLPHNHLRSKLICIDHFDKKYIKENGKRTRLRKDAIPEPYKDTELNDRPPSPPDPSYLPLRIKPTNKVYQNKKRLCEEETRCTVVLQKKRKLQNKDKDTPI
ncbi:hypothetical protein ABMA28_011270, partial [Loxostege sticticalis]